MCKKKQKIGANCVTKLDKGIDAMLWIVYQLEILLHLIVLLFIRSRVVITSLYYVLKNLLGVDYTYMFLCLM